MRKFLLFIMVSSLLLFTRCKKDNESPSTEETVPVRLELPIDKTRSDFSDLFPFHQKKPYF